MKLFYLRWFQKVEQIIKHLALLFFSLPSFANLYFSMPETGFLETGQLRIDFSVSSGLYLIARRKENRTYLPDMKVHAQLSQRIALSAQYFGIYRNESQWKETDIALEDGDYRGGDLALATWLDWIHKPDKFVLKSLVMVKIPMANDEDKFGSDQTDVMIGTSGHLSLGSGYLAGLVRLDIIGRGDRDQWDYVTFALRGATRLGDRFELLLEGWHRTRSTNTTSLFSLGMTAQVATKWSLTLVAGAGQHDGWETNPDSRLEHQFSLEMTKRFKSPSLKRWLGQ